MGRTVPNSLLWSVELHHPVDEPGRKTVAAAYPIHNLQLRRLARYLVELSHGTKQIVELPISKSQLASNLGTVSETLSRTLRKLSEDDLIKVAGKKVEILDFGRLEELAKKCKEG